MTSQPRIVGLLPAGGHGTRISPLPMSKELYPIGFRTTPEGQRPKVVGHYLLEKMRRAGVVEAFWILRPGKWDIPAYFGDGTLVDMSLAYLTVHVPYGVPFTLNQAYPFVRDAIVVMGFPDILFQPEDAYCALLQQLQAAEVDVAIGLFPTSNPTKVGVVDFEEATGKVHQITEKPKQTTLKYMWAIAAWKPSFTEFLHTYLPTVDVSQKELPIGDALQAGIDAGLEVHATVFPTGHYCDIGTPDDLIRSIQSFSTQAAKQFD